MKHWQKTALRLTGAGCAALLLALPMGCGGKTPTASGAAADGYRDMGGYEFRIAAWWDGTPDGKSEASARALKLQQDAEKNYNCKITYQYIPQANIIEKLTASVMAKDPFADIVWLEANSVVPQLAKAGYIMPTDDLFDFSDPKWPAYGVQASEMGGKHYGFVADIASTYGIWYNKTFFAKYGLPDLYELQQKDEWNWDAFADIARRATTDPNNDGVNDTFGFGEVGWEPIVDRFIASNGSMVVKPTADGSYRFNVDDPAAKEAISFVVDLFQRGYKSDSAAFVSGKCAMFAGDGFWGSQTFQLEMDDDLGFVWFPKGPRATEYVCTSINTNVMTIPTNSKRPEDTALIFEAITDWAHLDEERLARMEGWMYNEEDVATCREMFARCTLHKWRAFGDLQDVFMEKIFYDCVKSKNTVEKAIAEHLDEGQAIIDQIMSGATASTAAG